MERLQKIRTNTGIIMPVNSGFRTPEHNSRVSHTGSTTGPHPDCQAADISVRFGAAFAVMGEAIKQGMLGIGPKQHGRDRYLHLDSWHRRSTGTVWTYTDP